MMATKSRCQNSEIPGRELLRFPVGLIAEPAALPGLFSGGFWNPAAAVLPEGTTWRLSAGAMSTPSDVSVSANAGAITGKWRGSSLTLSLVRAAVGGLVRTDSDPLTIGTDVQYSTIVASVGIARPAGRNFAWGLAARFRSGQIDLAQSDGISLDGGVVADHITSQDLRVGVSTLLSSPWSKGHEHASFIGSADIRVAQLDSARVIRTGIAMMTTQGSESEQFLFASGRYGAWELRGGPVRTYAYGGDNLRTRLGLAVRHAGYAVGVAREGSPNGLGPTYQFVLSSVIR